MFKVGTIKFVCVDFKGLVWHPYPKLEEYTVLSKLYSQHSLQVNVGYWHIPLHSFILKNRLSQSTTKNSLTDFQIVDVFTIFPYSLWSQDGEQKRDIKYFSVRDVQRIYEFGKQYLSNRYPSVTPSKN